MTCAKSTKEEHFARTAPLFLLPISKYLIRGCKLCYLTEIKTPKALKNVLTLFEYYSILWLKRSRMAGGKSSLLELYY